MEQRSELTEAESRHLQQLVGLLGELISEHGKAGAAVKLGVGYRTVLRSLAAGKLSRGLRMALEKHLLLREGAEVPESPWAGRLDDLEQGRRELAEGLEVLERRQTEQTQQLISVAGELQSARGAISELVQKAGVRDQEVRKALAESLSAQQEIRRRLDQVEKRSQVRVAPQPVRETAVQAPGSAVGAVPSRNGDGYDEKTEALVTEWRRLKTEQAQARTRLDRVTAAEARLELEIELIREHEMGIPPGERWGLGVRYQQVSWRWSALADRRRERRRLTVRRWVRRILTLGMWRR